MRFTSKDSTSAQRNNSTPDAKKKQKTLTVAVLVALAIIIIVALIFAFVPGAESGLGGIFSGAKTSGYVPETQDGTTIISQYYENGILPTSGNRHDVTVIEGGGASVSEIEGIWSLDGVTIYEFDGLGRGIMLTAVDNYTFVYSAQDGKLIVDFDVDDAKDGEFAYHINGDKLTMSRGGRDYELTKSDTQ